jgi:hypothetical protein
MWKDTDGTLFSVGFGMSLPYFHGQSTAHCTAVAWNIPSIWQQAMSLHVWSKPKICRRMLHPQMMRTLTVELPRFSQMHLANYWDLSGRHVSCITNVMPTNLHFRFENLLKREPSSRECAKKSSSLTSNLCCLYERDGRQCSPVWIEHSHSKR